jgi:hypothetical protein
VWIRRAKIKSLLMWVGVLGAVVGGLLCPASLFGQCQKSDFPESSDTAAAPSRPTETSAPDPIGVGVVETEAGFAHSWVSSDTSQTLFSNMFKLGAWCNVEVRWSANTFMNNTVGSDSDNGFGDNYLAVQYRFHRETKRFPSMAVGYTVKFDSADPIELLGSGYVDHLFMVMFAKTVGKTSIAANLNYFVIGTGPGHLDDKVEYTLMASRPIYGKLGVIGEIYYDSHLNNANLAYGNSTWALTYTVRPRVVIDGGAYIGFSSGPGVPGTSAFIGVSYAIGNWYRAAGWGPRQKSEEEQSR